MDSTKHLPSRMLLFLTRFRKLFFLAAFMALVPLFTNGQNINSLEYYFDVDPGFGNGTAVSVTPAPHINNMSFSASISSLSEGFHTLYVRARDDSSRWSHTLSWPFYKLSVSPPSYGLNQIEYFFNTDPGPGNGTAINISPVNVIDPYSFTINIAGLNDGFNTLFVRTKNEGGVWSFLNMRSFYKLSIQPPTHNLSAVEYFFDTDPGFGMGTLVPLTSGSSTDSMVITADISSFADGFHNLFVRAKDVFGGWSLVQFRSFYKLSVPVLAVNIVAAEYFIGNDPGAGLGTPIALNPASNIDSLGFTVDISGLSDGFYNLAVRVKDSEGKWSLTNTLPFYHLAMQAAAPDILAVEYYFNNDPGFGQGTPVAFTPGTDVIINLNVDISSLNEGFNHLFIRAKSADGKWSLSQMRSFYKEDNLDLNSDIVYAEYFIDSDPGLYQGTPITLPPDTTDLTLAFDLNIDTLSEGFHRLFIRVKDESGKWSLTNFRPFYRQEVLDTLGDIVAVEYFIDTDPGFGHGIQVPVVPQANIPFLAWGLDLSNIAFGQHNLFIRTKDEFGVWSQTNMKEIFYYLDSLPTASLSGPVGICIYDTGYFEVTLTGTGPWNIVFNNGFQTDTISNIAVTPHFIPVVPDSSGNFTAQVLMVQDIYYTGLYTGIPIEYQVYPLPVPAGAISGPHNVCEGSTSVGYSVYYVGNASAYHWTVPPGAVIVSSGYYWYYHYIYVDFPPGAQSGNITVRGVNHCGEGVASTLMVTLRSHPTVDAGPDQYIPFGDSAVLFASPSGGNPPYNYSWQPWWVFDNSGLQSPTAWPGATMGVSVTVSDTFGCTAADGLTIFVGNPNGTDFSGFLRYDNAAGSPLSFSSVMMKQGDDIIYDTLTAVDGSYRLPEVAAGYYQLTASSDKAWGGVNSTDALLILKHFVDSVSLGGLRRVAADVNASGFVNAVDALLIAKRFVGIIDTFPSGDWHFENVLVYSNPSGFQTHDLKGILFGDVDASYTPLKQVSGVRLGKEGKLKIDAEGVVKLPLMSTQDLELGAISVVLEVPSGFSVRDVSLGDNWGGELVYNIQGNELRIAWFGLNPLNIKSGETLLFLNLAYTFIPKGLWRIGDESSLADGQGKAYQDIGLYFPELIKGDHGFILGNNYPNPFNSYTQIPYTLPAQANVKVSILNLLGEEVLLLHEGLQDAGQHSIHFDAALLAPGIYHYRLLAETAGQRFEQTRKMVVIH